jgi:peptidyl-tRNA hydrolase, PTH1 family
MDNVISEVHGIRMVVGLGNPGRRYARTRHNIGFMVVDELAGRLGARAWHSDRLADTVDVTVDDHALLLVKPMTFMNLSGQAVRASSDRLKVSPPDILVVSDDLDLPYGRIRLRPAGSTGGHNGLRSVAADLDTQAFPRLRIGIGRPEVGDPIDWVLAPFSSGEAVDLPVVVNRACDIVICAIVSGLRAAMDQYNGRGGVRELEPATKDKTPEGDPKRLSTEVDLG